MSDRDDLTPEEARNLGRKVAQAWLAQREALAAFLEGLGEGLTTDPPTEEEPIDSDPVVFVKFDPMGGLDWPSEDIQ